MFSAGQYLRLALAIGMLGKVSLTTIEKEPTAPEFMMRVQFVGSVELPHIEQDELIVVLQRRDIAKLIPALQAIGESVLKYERRSLTFDLIVDTDALTVDVWHTSLSTACVSEPLLSPQEQKMAPLR